MEILPKHKYFSISLTKNCKTHGDFIQQRIHYTTFKMHWDAIILLMETRDRKKIFKHSSCNSVLIQLEIPRTTSTSSNYLPNSRQTLKLL